MIMKVSVKKIVEAYKMLGEAKVSKLEESEVVKVIKARKAMRPVAEDFEAFLKDAQDKFKPECWDDVQKKISQWQEEGGNTTLTDAEKRGVNTVVVEYQNSINKAINEELEREIEIEIEKLKDGSDVKLMSANDWTPNQLDALDVIL